MTWLKDDSLEDSDELPERANYGGLVSAVQPLAKALETQSITGKLWIMEIGRIRIRQDESQDDLEK